MFKGYKKNCSYFSILAQLSNLLLLHLSNKIINCLCGFGLSSVIPYWFKTNVTFSGKTVVEIPVLEGDIDESNKLYFSDIIISST